MSHYMTAPSFDGPSDTRSQPGGFSASGSNRSPSNVGTASGPVGYPAPLGFDPARMEPVLSPEENHRIQVSKRVDLPAEAYMQKGVHPFATRPGLGKDGKQIAVKVNQFRVMIQGNQDVYQYDVSVTPEPKKPSFTNVVWKTAQVQEMLKTKAGAHPWVFDGRKIAWSRNNIPEMRVQVDMDKHRKRAPQADRAPDVVYVIIKKTTTVRLDYLRAYLQGQTGWDDHVLECVNFLDHILREMPSQHLLAIKRNFYDPNNAKRGILDDTFRHIEAIKGIYAAFRTTSSIRSGGTGLSVNVDVANTAFWSTGPSTSFLELAVAYLKSSKREYNSYNPQQIIQALKPVQFAAPGGGRPVLGQSDMFKMLRRMAKLTFFVKHRGKTNDSGKTYKIKGFIFDPAKYPQGANARNVTFDKQGKRISIYDYFMQRYNIQLKAWEMPLVETTRDGIFPMETIIIHPFQRYNFKLDGDQTTKMLKFAVTRPKERFADIMSNIKTLRWSQDPYLRDFGVMIKDQMENVKARVIQNPVIQFAKTVTDPKTSGRWDLRGQAFAVRNPRPLTAWSVVIVNNCVQPGAVQQFLKTFIQIYKGHGGQVNTLQPPIKSLQFVRTGDTGDQLVKLYNETGQQFKASPDMMLFILPSKDQLVYERLKKSMDIRLATLSQMVLANNVMKNQAQYCSNVATKVNAKLGGATSKLAKVKFFQGPTMMIGVDVSHGAHGAVGNAGLPIPSMAAITMSMDPDAVTYAAACQTNGYRKEVLDARTIHSVFPGMVTRWYNKMRAAPQHIFYFRDGVSEGEFQKVLDNEVEEVRKIVLKICGQPPKITVIVGTKRHHIRFFPEKPADGDKNMNPLPGTVVEQEVTHPFHYDFYLCSHVAIQGTARPVHYHVLKDEVGMPVDLLQKMIYQQCYQYVRSTTPVSLHPAIYYAHLAAARARAHEDINASDRDPQRRRDEMQLPLAKHNERLTTASSKKPEIAPDLMPIGGNADGDETLARTDNINFFKSTMWFI